MLSLSYWVASCITYLALRCKDLICYLYSVVRFPAVALRLGVFGFDAPGYFDVMRCITMYTL